MTDALVVRTATEWDLDRITAMQTDAPEASHWPAADYLRHHTLVAECDGVVAGFLVWMQTMPGEADLINVVVDREARRRGIGRALLARMLEQVQGAVFLEVRESNAAAIELYTKAGFTLAGRRPSYYSYPSEDAVVMKFHSC